MGAYIYIYIYIYIHMIYPILHHGTHGNLLQTRFQDVRTCPLEVSKTAVNNIAIVEHAGFTSSPREKAQKFGRTLDVGGVLGTQMPMNPEERLQCFPILAQAFNCNLRNTFSNQSVSICK